METDIKIVLGRQIAIARKECGFTQEQLASHVGITARGLQRFESGVDFPKYLTLFKMCVVLGVHPNDLIDPVWVVWRGKG